MSPNRQILGMRQFTEISDSEDRQESISRPVAHVFGAIFTPFDLNQIPPQELAQDVSNASFSILFEVGFRERLPVRHDREDFEHILCQPYLARTLPEHSLFQPVELLAQFEPVTSVSQPDFIRACLSRIQRIQFINQQGNLFHRDGAPKQGVEFSRAQGSPSDEQGRFNHLNRGNTPLVFSTVRRFTSQTGTRHQSTR